MLVYQGSKAQFVQDVLSDDIADIIKAKISEKMHRSTPAAEYNSWSNSLRYMKDAVDTPDIPDGCGVAIEYNVPLTSKRVDFILSGRAADGTGVANIVELKQWSDARALTDYDAVVCPVETYTGGALREVAHPSYQAWSYAQTISDFNSSVQDKQIMLYPCAYAHNYEVSGTSALAAPQYQPWIVLAPLFGKHENAKVRDFLRSHIARPDDGEVLRDIDNGRIRPSKSLQDALVGMLDGNREFVLLDGQKVYYEKALRIALRSHVDHRKRVYIVKGGPGTGKSVLAINLLVELTRRGQGVQYVSKNSAPRNVYSQELAGHMSKTRIAHMFRGSGAFIDTPADAFDTLIVDEAHRLNERSGLYGNQGENQIKEIIHAGRCTVFFLDESQRVTTSDIGSEAEIRRWADEAGAEVYADELQSQFRCNGSDGYLSWLDDALQIRETANWDLDDSTYDFEVVDSPAELKRMIVRRNADRNKARLVAGYCWSWPKESKPDPTYHDIQIGDWSISWNLGTTDTYAIDPDSVNEAGCIHTVQGLEFDYVGVIIGPDMAYRDGRVVTDYTQHPGQDRAMKGLKTRAKKDPAGAQALGDELIRNTYRTLMTRGMKGCYVYCCDKQLGDYLRARAHRFVGVEYSSDNSAKKD